ncbi:MAG TPA: pitrilysin family protein [Thermoanaerobaculia bacterium]|nr:pitrilysin family protein [Thermoanaerobaculia bacterium]
MTPRNRSIRALRGLACAALLPALLLLLALPAAAQAQRPVQRPEELKYPPLPQLDVPQPQRVVLDNGLVVMLLEDHELPLVEAIALIDAGAKREPADHVGLAGITGMVLRSGGSESMPGDQLDQFLENKAASIETSIGTDFGSASMSALAQDFPEVFRAFADLLRNPTFEQDKLAVAKNQVTSSISRQNDDPQGILFREFDEIVYGERSPYAWTETYETVGNIDRADLVAWHEKYFHPNRMVLGLVGDFDSTRALALVRQAFGDWPAGPARDEGTAAYFDTEPSPGVFAIQKDDITQANIAIGHLGIRRDNPDYIPVSVLNQVLGGGFSARLFSNIRSAKGLAYAVSGGVGSNWNRPGLFRMWMTTKTGTTAAAIDALLEEARRLETEPPSDEEIAKAKQSILQSFVFESDSMRKILDQQVRYEFFGYPLDWLERYRAGVEAVDPNTVRQMAAKYIHPERFSIVVVAPAEGMDRPLTEFGEVAPVDITIPEPPVERAEVTAEGQARAGELLDRAVAAMGGAERIDRLQALATRGNAVQLTPQGEMEIPIATTHLFPDRYRQELTLPFGSISMVLRGDSGFVVGPQGTMDLPASQLGSLRSSADRDPLSLLRSRGLADFRATVIEPIELDGTPLERLQLEVADDVTVVAIDPQTGQIRQISYREAGPTGTPGEVVQTFSDYREVDGITYPFAVVGTFDGNEMMRLTLESVEVDPEVDETAFERPE